VYSHHFVAVFSADNQHSCAVLIFIQTGGTRECSY